MKFIFQDGLLPGANLTEKFEAAKRLGTEGIELNISFEKFTRERVNEVSAAMEATGILPVTLCGGYRGWLGHFDRELRETAVKDIQETMKECRELGITGLIAPAAYGMHSKRLPPFTSPRTEEEDMEVLIDGLEKIREAAEKYEVLLLLEPLNRYEDHMINTVEQAVNLVKKADSPYIKVMADLYHMNIEEADIGGTIRRHGSYIKHVHLGDSNRLQPGKGHIDFREAFDALRYIDFKGFMAYECRFSGDNREQDIKNSLNFLKNRMGGEEGRGVKNKFLT